MHVKLLRQSPPSPDLRTGVVPAGSTFAANPPSWLPEGLKSLRVGVLGGHTSNPEACSPAARSSTSPLCQRQRERQGKARQGLPAFQLVPSPVITHQTIKCQEPLVAPPYQEEPGHCVVAHPISVVDFHTSCVKWPALDW